MITQNKLIWYALLVEKKAINVWFQDRLTFSTLRCTLPSIVSGRLKSSVGVKGLVYNSTSYDLSAKIILPIKRNIFASLVDQLFMFIYIALAFTYYIKMNIL